MSPTEQRIADRFRHCSCPGQKFVIVGGISGDVGFRHTVCTHQAPFVVIPVQPRFGNILKISILVDFLWIKMAMIVDNRHIVGVVME
ncbi:hypothetical protein D3C77_514310 [compost metagenome]